MKKLNDLPESERFKICSGCVRILDTFAEIHYKSEKEEKENLYCIECASLLQRDLILVQNEALLSRQQRFNFEKKSINKLNVDADRAPKGCVWLCVACSRTGVFKSRVQFLCGNLREQHEQYICLAYAYSVVYDQNNQIVEFGKFSRKDN